MSLVVTIFALLVVYQLKHFLADYLLQGEYMLGKFKPGWGFLGPLLAHVGVHGLMTFAIAGIFLPYLDRRMLFDQQLYYASGLALFDGTVHFLMDRLKAGPKYMGRWKPLTAGEWLHSKALVRGMTPDCDYRGTVAEEAQKKLRGNKLFWWALGFDQMVHHLTHYACIYGILKITGAL